ncbi:hypothetical protein NP233_g10855 [Leucocoprinus birnbaumii]|uniref:Uncharacterized protein n=1 Tax=Leucocoprinus birnbaumii TaxID=56174 RepID=A0AAD5YRH2_9AGAR|nr:hypothetical protein NP233_g10855 [Leucocoprinus birnbaumii]
MDSPSISPFIFRIELPVSREIDHEILVFLTDEFKKIRESHGLPESWPSEEVLALIVKHGAGLWIYVSVIVRFIKDENSFGPEDQLRIVLEFLGDVSNKLEANNPLAEMDFFYTLIMQCIPLNIQKTVQKIILLSSSMRFNPIGVVRTLGLSVDQLRQCCLSIRSVMELQDSTSGLREWKFHFYHASFVDFLTDSKWSKEFCIHGEFLIQYRRELLEWLHFVISHTTVGWGDLIFHTELEHLNQNLPVEFRDIILRREKCPTPWCTQTHQVWIFGQGDNEAIAYTDHDGDMGLHNNQNPPPGRCPCNFQG